MIIDHVNGDLILVFVCRVTWLSRNQFNKSLTFLNPNITGTVWSATALSLACDACVVSIHCMLFSFLLAFPSFRTGEFWYRIFFIYASPLCYSIESNFLDSPKSWRRQFYTLWTLDVSLLDGHYLSIYNKDPVFFFIVKRLLGAQKKSWPASVISMKATYNLF